MNKTTYYLKHLEYLLRKCRSYLISDINFHLSRLKATHGDTFDIKSPATLNEKFVIVWSMTIMRTIRCWRINWLCGNMSCRERNV